MTDLNRVAAAVIVGDQYDTDEVGKMLRSLEPHVGGVFVSYNGKKSRFPRWSGLSSIPIKWEKAKWEDDFAVARNHSFSMIPKADFEWVLWLDTDDILVAPEGFGPIWESLDGYTEGIFLRYAYAIEPETGATVVEQWRERLLSTAWRWNWKWPVHECAVGPPGTQFARREEAWIEHLRKSGEDRGARERNRRIISRAMEKEPDEPRYLYYSANESLAEASSIPPGPVRDQICDQAIALYKRFIMSMAQRQTDDVYGACIRVGNLFVLKGDINNAVDHFLQAVKFYPSWPDAYVEIAKVMMDTGDFPRMRDFADIACRLPKPSTVAALETLASGFHPLFLRGIGKENTGDLKGAVDDYRAALEVWTPPNDDIQGKIRHIEEIMAANPSADMEKAWDVRKELRGTSPDKSICFFTNPIAEVWNYETLAETGHGGSETLVLQTAEMFARDGWRAVIFGMPGNEKRGVQGNGVEMYNYDEWLPSEEFTVFVSSRAGDPFTAPINARAKFLWMHDVNAGPGLKEISTEPDKIVGLTEWHVRHMSRLYGIDPERFTIVPNGIDLSLFPERTEWSEKPKLIWSSSPDRGLETLLGMWPMIRRSYPDATLDIYYGWEFIDKLIARGAQLQYLKDKITGGIAALGGEGGGIFWRDRVPPDQLVKAMYGSEFWAYPTQFMETFCLTAVMCQAAGVIPVCSDLAGLRETVACKYYKTDGWPLNSAYQTSFLQRLGAAMGPSDGEQRLRDKAREMGRAHAVGFSLDASYAAWHDLFVEHGVEHRKSQVVLPSGVMEPIGSGFGKRSSGSV